MPWGNVREDRVLENTITELFVFIVMVSFLWIGLLEADKLGGPPPITGGLPRDSTGQAPGRPPCMRDSDGKILPLLRVSVWDDSVGVVLFQERPDTLASRGALRFFQTEKRGQIDSFRANFRAIDNLARNGQVTGDICVFYARVDYSLTSSETQFINVGWVLEDYFYRFPRDRRTFRRVAR